MNPALTKLAEDHDILSFTLTNLDMSIANAVRRTVLNDIPNVVLGTNVYQDNKCIIKTNTGRIHNELVKHRLSCIPVHITQDKEMETFPEEYVVVLDMKNDTDTMMIVTTEDFKIKQKSGDKFLSADEVHSIFPPDPMTRDYIDIVRLRPKIGDTIPGEQISLTCEFTVQTAKVAGNYNVVSKCSYGNTIDIEKAEEAWERRQTKLAEENSTKEEIEFQKRNFYLLDAQRYFTPNSFDFQVQTVGVFDNKVIIKKACQILRDYFLTFYKHLDSELVPINTSLTTVENSFDVVLLDADYTTGKVLEYILYDKFFEGAQTLSYCGFKKVHPHDSDSIIRIAYKEQTDKELVKQNLRDACQAAAEVFLKINDMF